MRTNEDSTRRRTLAGICASALMASVLVPGCGSKEEPDTTEEQPPIQQMELALDPAKAPPIVFAADREKEYRLYAIEPDGSGRRELTSEFALSPSWSSDGSTLAFVGSLVVPSDGDDGHGHDEHGEGDGATEPEDPVHGDIGTTDFRLGLLAAEAGSTTSREVGEARGEPMYPTLDPDTGRVYFQVTPGHTRSGKEGKIRAAIDSVASGQEGVRTELQGRDSFYQPAWSPDGDSLAVIVSSCEGADCSQALKLYDRSLENPRAVTEQGVAGTPAWSPDGRKIAFSWTRDGEAGIWMTEIDGNPVRVTRDEADTGPSFSPDGRQIVFGRKCDLYRVNVDGTGLRNLTRTPRQCEITPSWRPR